jgi:hypothetical protein
MTLQCPNITRKANERSVMDISRGEMVERELDTMIERRSRQKDPDEEHELWQESVRRYNARRREENRLAWCDYFCRLAGSLRARAEEYDRRAAVLEDRGEGAYLASTCTATKRDGSPCTLPSYRSDGLCWAHDPKNAERRRRGQSRGGKSKPSKELAGIKQRLSDLADSVLGAKVDKGVAAVASQILNVYLRSIELERRIKETDELEAHLEALEQQKGGSRWPA